MAKKNKVTFSSSEMAVVKGPLKIGNINMVEGMKPGNQYEGKVSNKDAKAGYEAPGLCQIFNLSGLKATQTNPYNVKKSLGPK